MAEEHLVAQLRYEWVPFTVDGAHLTFAQHVQTRLERKRCSAWGPAVYKWEGLVDRGPHAKKVGILIGETGDLRQRIKQYVSGTQDRGNKLWRKTFLELGPITLYTLSLNQFTVAGERIELSKALASNNLRLVVEQLLVMRALAQATSSTWFVSREW